MARLFKVEMYVIPLNIKDEVIKSPQDLMETIMNDDLKEDCLIQFGIIEMKNIGEWNDNIKFNLKDTPIEEYRKEFTKKKVM